MVTKKFVPSISQKDIIDALATPEGFKYPEHVRSQLLSIRAAWLSKMFGLSALVSAMGVIAVIVFSGLYFLAGVLAILAGPVIFISCIFLSAARLEQSSPEKTACSFYKELLCYEMVPDYAKAFQLLVPSAFTKSASESINQLKNNWVSVVEQLSSITKELCRDKATCSLCAKDGNGFWTAAIWQLEDSILPDQDFVRCKSCEAVYCSECFKGLGKHRECSNCKTDLGNAHLRILMSDPRIYVKFVMRTSTEVKQEQRRVAHVEVSVGAFCSYRPSWPTSETKEWRVAGKGPGEFSFFNTAVEVGEKWYLVSGEPGEISSLSD